jgi:peroxiredoxin
MKYLPIIVALTIGAPFGWAGTSQVAAQVKDEYESAMRRWAMNLQTAVGPEARELVAKERPDPDEFGRRMWVEIGSSLRAEWSLEYSPWLLEVAPNVLMDTKKGALKRTPLQEIMRDVELMHLKSAKVGRLCVALASYPDPAALALVEKVGAQNPHDLVQGQAAIAEAILLRHIGDGPEVLNKRRDAVQRAIIKAAHVKVGDTTVGKLAMDELYIVKHLVVGKLAPEANGKDISGLSLDLKRFRGKVVILAFWHSGDHNAQQTIDLLTKLHKQAAGRPVQLLGVTQDSNEILRELKSKGVLPWRNFADADGKVTEDYRVRKKPKVFVLDQLGIIRFIGVPGSFVELAVDDLVKRK